MQGPGEQDCARTSSAQVSIVVPEASGDAHTEGVKEQQTTQQSREMSRPADSGSFEDGHPQQLDLQHHEEAHVGTQPWLDEPGEAQRSPCCTVSGIHKIKAIKAPLNQKSKNFPAALLGALVTAAAGAGQPGSRRPRLGMGRCGVSREPRGCPGAWGLVPLPHPYLLVPTSPTPRLAGHSRHLG